MNEAQTRKQLIDTGLKRAGWNLSDPSQVSLEFDIYLGNGSPVAGDPFTDHQFADYLLLARDGFPLVNSTASIRKASRRLEHLQNSDEQRYDVLSGKWPAPPPKG